MAIAGVGWNARKSAPKPCPLSPDPFPEEVQQIQIKTVWAPDQESWFIAGRPDCTRFYEKAADPKKTISLGGLGWDRNCRWMSILASLYVNLYRMCSASKPPS